MILGIGVDMVSIPEIKRLLEEPSGAFARRTFTEREREQAGWADPDAVTEACASRLAGTFAAKEATFKAVAQPFDLRLVEVPRADTGAPYIETTGPLEPVLAAAGVTALHLSITNEAGLAVAMVLAEG